MHAAIFRFFFYFCA
ncbi:MAG: pheST operon leader peptide PheM [Pantoea sp. Pent]|nr:pheST operon leader peptide PheM [Pantoea sp. Pent]